ncbi:uncharacterized protein PRCAT00002108001 [Priceomyces carsonii]|uniref:uncharacterized protein n=1 Tax=Priceomyces carsonii TaxID=28549 RepID=UPI002EDA2A48|nr:unnamed protein product [Priceomyces carsonii]
MLVPYPSCESCFVHDGVYKAVKVIKESTWGTIKSAVEEYSDYELISTGHSLGGVELAKDFDTSVTIVSHAALKTGNPQSSDYVDRLFSSEEYLDIVT